MSEEQKSDYPYDEPTPEPAPPPEGQQEPDWTTPPVDLSTDRYGLGPSSTGFSANAAGALSYVLGLVSGIIFFFWETKSKFVKFHAVQSMFLSVLAFVVNGVAIIFSFVPLIGGFVNLIVSLALLVVWIFCIVQAANGKWFKLPVIGDLAAKQVGL